MKQGQQDELTENETTKAQGEPGAYTFFALLCFLVAIIFLSIFLGNALNGFSSTLILLAVIIFGFGGVYLLGQRPSQKREEENDFQLENSQHEAETGEGIVEGTLAESSLVLDAHEDDESLDAVETEAVENEDRADNREDENDDEDEDEGENEDEEDDFITLVEEALDSVPSEFKQNMENLVVLVEGEPDREVLQRVGTREGYTLLGLYEGTPLTAQDHSGAILPERITIYQHTIEKYCHGDPDRIRQQVHATLLHEIAHHFGIDHDEMPIWVK